jgi:prevent-host-death family protein
MKPINIYVAKTRFSELVDKAVAGDEVIVSRHGKPLVRITRLEGGQKQRIKFGTLKGKIKLSADFDAALPDEVIADFEGR